jgi:hypothetical protein
VNTKQLLVVFLITVMLAVVSLTIIEVVMAAPRPCEPLRKPSWTPPAIGACFAEDRDLWGCIRHGQYRKDI